MNNYPDNTDPRVGTTFTTVDGWSIRVDTEPDYDAHPYNADCYTAPDIAAWESGEWSYVGCLVTASREGVQLGEASLWGIEDGYFTYTDEHGAVLGHGYVGPYKEAVDDLIAEAIADGKAALRRLCAGLVSK